MFKGLTRPRRVVITGMGCVTPLGIGRDAFWNGLITGQSGVRRIEAFDPSDFPVQIAAEVPSFDWQSQLNPKDRNALCRSRSLPRVKRSKTRNSLLMIYHCPSVVRSA
jgi:3-oxoacyl-[acyl-carrier-protein] synthase II